MRVVAGTAKGRRLLAPTGDVVRPTSDRVREAVCNALVSMDALDGARVLDLFAGTGAMGIEALSRGAASATFVDQDRSAIAALRANLDALGMSDSATVESSAVEAYLARAGGRRDAGATATGVSHDDANRADGTERRATDAGRRSTEVAFDLAFADPPYGYLGWDAVLSTVPADLVVLESDVGLELGPGWETLRDKQYGTTVVVIARRVS